MTVKYIHVVAAVIKNADGEILIAKRPDHTHQGGLWEFPGGKVDAGETAREALNRELREELAIDVRGAAPFMEIHHEYPDKSVFLDIWLVDQFAGEAVGNEGQPISWVLRSDLKHYAFPEANQPIIEKLLA
ncbi:MAG: 8-oxo-dGTP diphosphatase MutT [Candidatus Pelagadaptatus aseana]|uniref:8-oxo-dGTP diphosphatase MutT n=1 Tax=Candidatus Pelagadaptatus aseana TaxID=3120508 RepID=UPI0039B3424A